MVNWMPTKTFPLSGSKNCSPLLSSKVVAVNFRSLNTAVSFRPKVFFCSVCAGSFLPCSSFDGASFAEHAARERLITKARIIAAILFISFLLFDIHQMSYFVLF